MSSWTVWRCGYILCQVLGSVCVRCTVQSENADSLTLHSVLYTYSVLHSAPYTYYQVLDIICSHISEQPTTAYFNRLF